MAKQYRIENPALVSICRVFGADIESIKRVKDGRILDGENLVGALSQLPEETSQTGGYSSAQPTQTGQLNLFVSR